MLVTLILADLLVDAEAAFKAKNYKQAVKLYDKAEQPLSPTASYFRASAHHMLDDPVSAIRDFAAAIKGS